MLAKIKEFFSSEVLGEETDPLDAVRSAAAALLLEVARADFNHDERELATVRAALHRTFGLNDEGLDELVAMAEDEAREATSSYQFTRLVNDHFDESQKRELIRAMWEVAYADGRLDKYEEHLIRRHRFGMTVKIVEAHQGGLDSRVGRRRRRTTNGCDDPGHVLVSQERRDQLSSDQSRAAEDQSPPTRRSGYPNCLLGCHPRGAGLGTPLPGT